MSFFPKKAGVNLRDLDSKMTKNVGIILNSTMLFHSFTIFLTFVCVCLFL